MMQRILEPELTEEAAQVKAYAEAGFSEPHGHFIELLKAAIDDPAFVTCMGECAISLPEFNQ